MSSSVGEVRERINAAADEAQRAQDAVGSVRESIRSAVRKLESAASDSSHDALAQAREQFEASLNSLSEVEELLSKATASAQEYLDQIL